MFDLVKRTQPWTTYRDYYKPGFLGVPVVCPTVISLRHAGHSTVFDCRCRRDYEQGLNRGQAYITLGQILRISEKRRGF